MSSTIFNKVIDAVVQDMLMDLCEPQDVQCVLVWAAGEQDIVFYADNGRIAGETHMGSGDIDDTFIDV